MEILHTGLEIDRRQSSGWILAVRVFHLLEMSSLLYSLAEKKGAFVAD